jgi:hypothetical protein
MGLGSIIPEQTTESRIISYTFHQQRHCSLKKSQWLTNTVINVAQLNGLYFWRIETRNVCFLQQIPKCMPVYNPTHQKIGPNHENYENYLHADLVSSVEKYMCHLALSGHSFGTVFRQ